MTTNGIARDPDATPVKITEPVPLSAAIDGGNNHGMIVLDKATEIAIDKCKKHGAGVVGRTTRSRVPARWGITRRRLATKVWLGLSWRNRRSLWRRLDRSKRFWGPTRLDAPFREKAVSDDFGYGVTPGVRILWVVGSQDEW